MERQPAMRPRRNATVSAACPAPGSVAMRSTPVPTRVMRGAG